MVVLLASVHCVISSCDHDEIEHLHASWLVGEGAAPFRDFVEHHHPTLYYLYAPLTHWLDGSPRALVATTRIVDLALLLAIVVALEHLRRKEKRRSRMPWTLVLLLGSWTFLRNSLEVRPDPFMNAFCVLGLVSWLAFLRDGRSSRAVLAGVFLAIATAFLQKAAALCVLLAIASLVLAAFRMVPIATVWRGALLVVSGALLPAFAFVVLVRGEGLWKEFVFWNYTFNGFYHLRSGALSFTPWQVFGVAIGEDPLPWVFGALGGLGAARAWWRNGTSTATASTLLIVTGGLFAAALLGAAPLAHYLLMLYPPLALLAADALEDLETTRWAPLIASLMLLMLVKVMVLCLFYGENRGHDAVQAWALQHSGRADAVYMPPPYHPIFRHDALYFWFQGARMGLAWQQYCRSRSCPGDELAADRRAWKERPPALVYTPPGEKDWWPFEWNLHVGEYDSVPGIPGLFRRRR
ncbi:MAG: hypothetical protein ACXWLR_02760 [Myxococcales bacterium]